MLGFTMTGIKRMTFLNESTINAIEKKLPVYLFKPVIWRSGISILMKAVLNTFNNNRRIYFAASFEGMPKPSEIADEFYLHDNKYLMTSVDEVKINFDKFELLEENIVFVKGWFCDPLPSFNLGPISVFGMDGDLYPTTINALKNLYYFVSVESYIIIDDYHSWQPCKNDVHRFF